jgi:hypothetical protein
MGGRSHSFALVALAAALLLGAARAAGEKVDFNRDIRPILSDTCFKCHGFDANTRKADLRLDTRDGALADLGGGHGAIVPGKPDESEAFRRIASDDIEEKMPPPDSGLVLTPRQVELFKKWIEQGADYQAHWSLIPPSAETKAPDTNDRAWPKNEIDRFVLARLEKEGLTPSPEADRATLIRRATLDLTGLPPTPAEVEAFLADHSPSAYERLVDRLLASPRYGEQMALRWLDLARFADTNGYQNDTERAQWRWRDWVIDAFNANQPFDQFTIDQLAGDLVPDATLQQKIASGFNRNHRITLEGGVIPEEYRVEYVIDRVETTATAWLGLTMGCARCHDHKYDPITQKDFYSFFAFFNHVPENGIDGRDFNSVPHIPAPREPERIQLEAADAKVAATTQALAAVQPAIDAGLATLDESFKSIETPKSLDDGLRVHLPLDGDTIDATEACGGVAAFLDGDAKYADGLHGRAGDFDGKRFIAVGDVASFEKDEDFSFGAWVKPAGDCDAAFIARMDEKDKERGYNLYWQRGLIHLQFMHEVPGNMITLVSKSPAPPDQWHHVFATYDGSGKAAGAKCYLNGKPLDMTVSVDKLSGSIVTEKVQLRIGGRTPGATRFKGLIDDVRVYERVLSAAEIEHLGGVRVMAKHVAPDKRSAEQKAVVRQLYLDTAAPPEQKQAIAAADTAKAEHAKLLATIPTVMVMSDAAPRETFVLKRGQYDMPGEKVTAAVPAVLPSLPTDAKADRLALAKWLVQPKHPLTARVAVNRFWESYFGIGLVKSSEDFGTQSEYPSHPELLDWLASEFVNRKWDVKAMQKLIVTSATYRQQSKLTAAMLEKDPENRLLARGPRLRLSAESLRDQALAASGLLVEKLGGPSVRPYQPPKIWEELTTGDIPGLNGQTYVQDHGESLYRRSMYLFWKRTVPLPTMTVFDAPSREVCTVRRSRTNTPLQALALLNDTIYVEAARKIAERAMSEGGAKPADRLTHAFRLAVARKPTDAELTVLVNGFNAHLATYFSDPEAATKVLGVGESPRNINFDPRELAAYAAQCGVILNMDQTITRE